MKLRAPARYFPLDKGLYEVAPGLRPLGSDFGNGEQDKKVFQFDSTFPKYRKNKLDCRAERIGKYYCQSDYSPEVSTAVNRLLVERLVSESPDFFRLSAEASGVRELACVLTGEKIALDSAFELARPLPPYLSAFDALCSQVQEDVAVVSTAREAEGVRNWLSSIHLCSPGHWAAEEKIGRDFVSIHKPVAGIEKVNQASASLVEAMIQKGPYTRFAWGFGSDDRLNHHPVPPVGASLEEWKGRTFMATGQGEPYLRVERQVLLGLPSVSAFVFTIRIYFISGTEVRSNPKERDLLISALQSMTPDNRVYKGLADRMPDALRWLSEQP